jgi:hypothetical protein
MTVDDTTYGLLWTYHYKSPRSSAMMAGGDAMLQIAQKLYNDGV